MDYINVDVINVDNYNVDGAAGAVSRFFRLISVEVLNVNVDKLTLIKTRENIRLVHVINNDVSCQFSNFIDFEFPHFYLHFEWLNRIDIVITHSD